MEDADANLVAIAKAMIRAFGERALPVMQKRVQDHRRAGETEGAEFWTRVEEAIRRLESGSGSDKG